MPADVEPRPVVDSSYSVSELLFFDTIENQNTYQAHPLHQAFIARYAALGQGRGLRHPRLLSRRPAGRPA